MRRPFSGSFTAARKTTSSSLLLTSCGLPKTLRVFVRSLSADMAHRHSRNWRWHKKLHIWLTKDELMTPQSISPTHEQGYYVIWDIRNWRKERVRETPSSCKLEEMKTRTNVDMTGRGS